MASQNHEGDTNECNVLRDSQRALAQKLERAYKSSTDFPDVLRNAHMAAVESKAVHLQTIGLTKKYGGTMYQIISTMIPLVRDGLEFKDTDLLAEAFDQVIKNADTMKSETEKMQTRYTEVNKQLGKLKDEIAKRNVRALEENVETQRQMQSLKNKIKEANEDKDELETECRSMEDEIQNLNKKMQTLSKKTGITADGQIALGSQRSGGKVVQIAGEVNGGSGAHYTDNSGNSVWKFVNWVVSVATQEQPSSKSITPQGQSTRKSETPLEQPSTKYNFDNMEAEIRNLNEKRNKLAEKIKNKIQEVTMFTSDLNTCKLVTLGDESSLEEAMRCVDQVDFELKQIMLFWESMVKQTNEMKPYICSREVLEDQKRIDAIRAMFDSYETECRLKGEAFRQYFQHGEKVLNESYKFLFVSV